ncbi:DUF6602 domain-containing protein [Brumimicrobium oceani]|uniref:DUF6602 domain-containing protein n=1 Tax=Brumimicrobium oceani TaxID=2100725 RepID=A0A2U2XEH3_9FLAO|nr:DUF6602 domain-containing protein [Brumimicrobium oceani]PWH86185.1 hypothetical protein DIT68_06415 [Brumimicrobium oceani]
MNDILVELTKFNVKNIIESFNISKKVFSNKDTNKLFHSGEFGGYREDIIKNWLKLYIPEKFGISSGFIITSTNKISTQCDIVIYNKDCTPTIDNNGQRFFPIETVVAIGEIKSDIQSAKSLNEILYKLAKIKELRLEIETSKPDVYERRFETTMKRLIDLNPDKILPPEGVNPNNYLEISMKGNPYDNIYTFLICNKFDFDYSKFEFDYKDIQPYSWHNSILSLNDGGFSYITPERTPNMSYPVSGKIVLDHYFTKNTGEQNDLEPSIRSFLTKLHDNIIDTTVFKFDILRYLTLEKDIITRVK